MERLQGLSERILEVADAVIDTFNQDGKVVLFGNGGSACDTQHTAAEMLGVTAGQDGKLTVQPTHRDERAFRHGSQEGKSCLSMIW